jgi:glycosyltransferase 2 family protein
MMKGPLARVVRVLVAIGLTGWLLWMSDPASVFNAARGADLRLIVLACVLVVADRVLMAYRWLTLLSPLEPRERPPFAVVMRIFFMSTFIGTFLPASVGGDAVRALSLSRQGVGGVDAVASVVMDRVLGVLSILIVALAGAWLAMDLVDVRVLLPALVLLGVLCTLAGAVVFSGAAARLIASAMAKLPRGQQTGDRLLAAIQRYSRYRGDLANVLICSVAVQILRVLQTYSLGLALGIAVPLGVYFALVPLILLIVLMPITINGLGTTQAAFVWLFGRAGVPNAESFALSVLFLAIAVVGNLPGGLLFVVEKTKRTRD